MRALLLVSVAISLVVVPALAAEPRNAAADPDPNGGWVTYLHALALSPYRYLDLELSASGKLRFATEYMRQRSETTYQLTPGELAYVRTLIAPLVALDSRSISRMATDVGTSSLRIRQADGTVVRLDWVHTEQPDLRAWAQFVFYGLAEKERYRLSLRPDNERLYSDLAGLRYDLGRVFRPQELREQLWRLVETQPLRGYKPLNDRGPLGEAIAMLGRLETPEEWAGRGMAAMSKLSADDRLRTASALSHYVNSAASDLPWSRWTPFFLEALRYARSMPAPPPGGHSWQQSARVMVGAAVQRLAEPREGPGDPRAQAVTHTAGATPGS